MKAQELLRAHVNKIPPDATMRDMVDMLDLYQVLLLPVVDDDDRLLGVVYEEQVLEAAFGDADALLEPESQARLRERLSEVRARDIMVSARVSVDAHDEAFAVLAQMSKLGLTRLPVTNDGRVIGTISRVDICQAFLEGEL